MRYCYQPWQIHILLENEMLKNVNFLKIGPRLDMPIGRQSFATNTPITVGISPSEIQSQNLDFIVSRDSFMYC